MTKSLNRESTHLYIEINKGNIFHIVRPDLRPIDNQKSIGCNIWLANTIPRDTLIRLPVMKNIKRCEKIDRRPIIVVRTN